MAPTTTAKTEGTKIPADFEGLTTFVTEQATAVLQQTEEIMTVAKKQIITNLQHSQTLALDNLTKVRELTAGAFPAVPAWIPANTFSSFASFGLDVAEQVFATERKIATSVIDLFAPAGS